MFNKTKPIVASAKVKEGALILYLPAALKPCVWRMDLDILSETSIEIDEKDGIYILATRDINGVIKSIAGFQLKADAQEALSLTLNALMANGSSSQGSSSFNFSFLGPLVKWGGIALLILGLGTFFLGTSAPDSTENTEAPVSQDDTVLDEQGNFKVGIPVDVDSIFKQNDE